MAVDPPRQLYMDVASKANAPLNKREKCAVGRRGKQKIPRRYHLMGDELIALKNEIQEKGRFVSPYGAGRLYTFIIESLVALGTGKAHPIGSVYSKFKELASDKSTKKEDGSTLWDRYSKKEPRNPKTARGPLAKFIQNIEVMQRLGGSHPYAFKLAQLGACIDIFVESSKSMKVLLRIGIPVGDPVRPVNMNRKRAYRKTVDQIPSGMIVAEDLPPESDSQENDE